MISKSSSSALHIKAALLNASASNNFFISDNINLLSLTSKVISDPYIIYCTFDKFFLSLPMELIVHCIECEQKCFAALTSDGAASNVFFAIINNVHDIIHCESAIILGYNKSLNYKLHDAEFFINDDFGRKISFFEDRNSCVSYHAQLGSMNDKRDRDVALAEYIFNDFDKEVDRESAIDAAYLLNIDFNTKLRNEFPALHGIIAYHYLSHFGKSRKVCDIVALNNDNKLRSYKYHCDLEAAMVLLSNKINTVVGFFSIGLNPTGSRDPLALRKITYDIVNIIIKNKIYIDIKKIIKYSVDLHSTYSARDSCDIIDEVYKFFIERLRFFIFEGTLDISIDKRICDAVIDIRLYDMMKIFDRMQYIQRYWNSYNSDMQTFLASYKRVFNILNKNKFLDKKILVNKSLFCEREDILFNKIEDFNENNVGSLNDEISISNDMKNLITLCDELELFFKEVMVNHDDSNIKNNRLSLLHRVMFTMNKVVNFRFLI